MRRLRRRVLIGAAVVALLLGAVATLRHFDRRPIDLSRFAPSDERVEPGEPPRGVWGGALLVVDPDAVRRAAGADASFAWLDMLEHEYGAVRWIRPEEIASYAEPVSVAVVSRSAASSVGGEALDRLSRLALAIVLEAPEQEEGVRLAGPTPILTISDLAGRVAHRRQGLLGADQRIAKRHGRYAHVREPEDLLEDEAHLTSETPDADRLVSELARRIDERVPVPRLWPYPAGAAGAFLLTHDEDEQGGEATLELLRRQAEWGARGTVFVIASGRLWETWPAAAVEKARRLGADVQLHWNRLPMPAGFWKVEPYRTVYRLATQRAGLRGAGVDAAINRTHYLHLGDDLSDHFRALAAAGIEADLTFGPNRAGRGYLFGTGRPFRIIDRNGMPSPVLEIAFHSQEDWGGVDEPFLERLFRASAAEHHATLGAIIHPHLIVRTEDGARLHRRMVDLARETGHWIATVSEYLAFRRARLATPVRVSRSEDGIGLVAEVTCTRGDFALVVPAGDLEVDGAAVGHRDGLGPARVPIGAGRHRLRLTIPSR